MNIFLMADIYWCVYLKNPVLLLEDQKEIKKGEVEGKNNKGVKVTAYFRQLFTTLHSFDHLHCQSPQDICSSWIIIENYGLENNL